MFLDTNVLVSAVATRGICADVLQAVLVRHRLVIGETVLAELRCVLRDKLKLPASSAEEVDQLLRGEAVVVRDAVPLRISIRDASDLPVLSEAVAGEADVLVTGDKDLLDVGGEAPVPIVSPRGFWERLRSDTG
ncbi:MAG TPA: putative toxin-antitoxin system toxin component, PIN family [Thermoanaerobaculia bacterium]|nr:putative toxin-antitoxin system toxin component, PIN family [Thermoanaerobaculia bacterium]